LFAARDSFSGPHQRFAWATPEQLRTAARFDGHLPISPTRGSYRFSDRTFVPSRGVRAVTGATRPTGFTVAPRSNYSRPAPATVANGWQRFGDPGGQRNYERGAFTVAPRGESGWHQFGRPPSQQPEPNRSSASRSYGRYAAPRPEAPGSGWRSFASRPAPQTWSGPTAPSFSAQPRYSAPERRFQQPAAPRYSQPSREPYRGPAGGNYSRPTPRSAPSGGGGSHGGGGGRPTGGGGHSRR
jgi:hypothetical protein